jgi:CRISPR/Cas system-associated protein endoribonuclease Cas2
VNEAKEEKGGSACEVPLDLLNESVFGAPLSSDSELESDSRSETGFIEEGGESERRGQDFVNKQFSFLHWNINGLLNKLFDSDFVSFVSSFDFVCLVETFLVSLELNVFSNHEIFCQSAVKLSQAGRPSGGIICLIRKDIVSFVSQIKVIGNLLMFVIDKSLFGLLKDVLYVCAYVPPEGSGYYRHVGEEGDGIALLEECIFEFGLSNRDCYVILSGDLNGRTSTITQTVTHDYDYDDVHSSGSNLNGRQSQDKVINGFGKSLINMCNALNLCILNGMCKGDPLGRFTYISPFGSSVIDYFAMSCDLLALMWDDCLLNIMDRVESSHMPVVMKIKFPNDMFVFNDLICQEGVIEKYIWNDTLKDGYVNSLLSSPSSSRLEDAISLIDSDVDQALCLLNGIIKDSAEQMKKRIYLNGKRKEETWFDKECREARRLVRKTLRRFRKTLSDEDRFEFCKSRREYKNLLFLKKKVYKSTELDKLVKSVDDQQEFWKQVHTILPRGGRVKNNISTEQWFEHFKKLLENNEESNDTNNLNAPVDDGDDVDDDVCNSMWFNQRITKDEILLAIRKLKLRKAPGPDGLPGEFFKNALCAIVPFFLRFFNVLFEKGIYPENWTQSIMLPLYKKGDPNNPSNYRGISLTDISGKIYGTIINRRIQNWVNENNITGECQAGFKKGYSTIDHMFTLLACVQKQLSLHRKLYVAFIDFEKCFDSINRNLLWPILFKQEIKGKLYRCIKSMYVNVKARVRSGSKLTDLINCSSGVKQGDSCSPVLFSIFINELAIEVIRQGKHGVTFMVDVFELFILLLADDVVLFSETPVGLQRQINSLELAATNLELKVNMDKSNIVVFRNGGYLGACEKWSFKGTVMPVVNAYKYLGIYFSTRLSFVTACKDIASKGKRVLFMIIRKLRMYNNQSFNVFCRLFDARVQPIVQYGAEIWGLDDAAVHCDSVHLLALKMFLSVKSRTPNDLVLKELKRYSITVNSVVRCICYWFKLLEMDNNRIPKKAYKMLFRLDEMGKRNWATKVRECLFQLGYGFVWLNQGVGNRNRFIKELKQRLIDCNWQSCNEHIASSNRFDMYRLFCSENALSLPVYLQLDIDLHIKWIMTKLRFGISELNVHRFRYTSNSDDRLLCPLCKTEKENEIHFLLRCPKLQKLRSEFISPKYYRSPNSFRMSLLMNNQNANTIRNVCIYVYKAFKLRQIMLT